MIGIQFFLQKCEYNATYHWLETDQDGWIRPTVDQRKKNLANIDFSNLTKHSWVEGEKHE